MQQLCINLLDALKHEIGFVQTNLSDKSIGKDIFSDEEKKNIKSHLLQSPFFKPPSKYQYVNRIKKNKLMKPYLDKETEQIFKTLERVLRRRFRTVKRTK